jgi:hypothetical protein
MFPFRESSPTRNRDTHRGRKSPLRGAVTRRSRQFILRAWPARQQGQPIAHRTAPLRDMPSCPAARLPFRLLLVDRGRDRVPNAPGHSRLRGAARRRCGQPTALTGPAMGFDLLLRCRAQTAFGRGVSRHYRSTPYPVNLDCQIGRGPAPWDAPAGPDRVPGGRAASDR